MATTVVPSNSNSISLASKFLPLVDQVYKQESKSAILDTANEFVRFDGANAVKLYNLSVQTHRANTSMLTTVMTM